jgi:hypothetical protein
LGAVDSEVAWAALNGSGAVGGEVERRLGREIGIEQVCARGELLRRDD